MKNIKKIRIFSLVAAIVVIAGSLHFVNAQVPVGVVLLEKPQSIVLTVTPDPADISVHGTAEFTATAYYCAPAPCAPNDDITSHDNTFWTTDDPTVVSIDDATGIATGVGVGTATITASYAPFPGSPDAVTDNAFVSVDLEVPSSIEVTPVDAPATLYVSLSKQFKAVAKYPVSPDDDITDDPLTVWDSGNPAFFTVNATGLATGVSLGTAPLTATYLGKTGSVDVTVSSTGGGGGGGTVYYPPPTETQETQETQTTEETQETQTTQEMPSTQETQTTEETQTTQETQTTEETQTTQETQEEPVEEFLPPPPPAPPPPGEEQFAPSPEGDLPPLPGEEPTTGETATGETGETTTSEEPIPGVLPPLPGEEPTTGETATGETGETTTSEEPLVYEQIDPVFLPPELTVTRTDVLDEMIDEFAVEETKEELLDSCIDNSEECLSIFLGVTQYEDVVVAMKEDRSIASLLKADLLTANAANVSIADVFAADRRFNLGKMQLYPDVPPEMPGSYSVNIFTLLADVQGYYQEKNSPFKPYQPITRIEALKVILGVIDAMHWLYYEELEAVLGGPEAVKAQSTVFADVQGLNTYQWWYPRYVNKACEIGVMECKDGSKFRPDDYITDAEYRGMVVNTGAYLRSSGYLSDRTGDPDGDNLKTYLEETVYYTDPNKADTDSDGLRDDEEVRVYYTSPFMKDSDADGLDDYQETKVHKTNPLKADTDGDGFNDSDEVRQGTDPLDPESFPRDTNTNQVADEWEEQYKVKVANGEQDTDRDGISDRLEYEYGTDPNLVDTDGDGFSDSEEILTLRTDPNDASNPGKVADLGIRITNFDQNQLIGDNTPMIKGIAPVGYVLRVMLRNEYGHEKVLGDVKVDDNGVFLLQVEQPIRDGKYMLVAKSLQPSNIRILYSPPVTIRIDSTLNVTPPKPTKIGDQSITEEVLLKNVRVEIRDKRPVLVGETEFGNKVTATWRSVVTTSALIADAVGGEFVISSPTDLEVGRHEVFVQAVRKRDNAQSDTIRVLFNIGVPLPGVPSETLKPSAEEQVKSEVPLFGAIFGGIAQAAETRGIGFWIMLLIILGIVGGAVYCKYGARKKKKDEEGEGQ